MKIPRHSRKKQQGIAVLTAILIAAIVASLAFALSTRERLWLNQMQNHQDLAAAQAVAFGAIDLARLTLRDDMRNSSVDHLLEPWTIPIPPINVDEGKVSGRLVEMQGRFNLFNLQNNGKINPSGMAILKRLLATRNLPLEWADKMALAMVKQGALAQTGASAEQRGLILPVANLTELADLTGIDAKQLATLEALVTILPEATAINVNFAPPELLVAITPGLTVGEAEQIVNRRAANYFNSPQDYVNALPEKLRSQTGASANTVESQYFVSEVDSWFGRAHVRLQAMIYRQHNRMPELLWVRRL